MDKKLHSTAEECRKLDAEVMALRRDASSHSSTAQRAQQELAEGRDKLRAAQYEAQRRCQQAEAEKAALAEQLAALTDHLQGAWPQGRFHGVCCAREAVAPCFCCSSKLG